MRTTAKSRGASTTRGIVACGARLGVAAATLAAALLGFSAEAAFGGAVISNGTVALGVNDTAQLNYLDESRFVGVSDEATGNDGTRAGCERPTGMGRRRGRSRRQLLRQCGQR